MDVFKLSFDISIILTFVKIFITENSDTTIFSFPGKTDFLSNLKTFTNTSNHRSSLEQNASNWRIHAEKFILLHSSCPRLPAQLLVRVS